MTRLTRPSLADGAIRPEGDPNKKADRQRLNIIYEQDGTDVALSDDDNPIIFVNHEIDLDDRNSPRFTTENNERRCRSVALELYKLIKVTLRRIADRRRSCSRSCYSGANEQEQSSPPLWTDVREWFINHPEHEDRHSAVIQKGESSTVSLHLLCQHSDPPLDIIIKVIEIAPEVVSFADDNGWLPLHYACAQGVDEEVLKVLINNNPLTVSKKDNRQRTPLHFAFFKSGNDDNANTSSTEEEKIRLSKTVEILTSCDNNVAQIADEKGRIPLHFAAAYGSSKAALKALVRACPESINVKEDLGRSPLHYVMANCHGRTSPSTLQFLLQHSNINIVDFEGNLPLDLLSERATKYNSLDDSPSRQNVEKCLNIFLNAKPPPAPKPEFFTALQSLPRWLRDRIITNAYVQDILYKSVSRRFLTMILLLDYYFYAMIIFCFHYASSSHIRFQFEGTELSPHTNGTIVACLLGASYFLVRETLELISVFASGTPQSWFFDLSSWLGVIVIWLVYYYCAEMIRGGDKMDLDDNFRTGAVLTLIALWIASINFMRKSSLEFALFFEAMKFVTRHLSVLFMGLIGFLIFFSQMFVVVYRKTPICSDACMANGDFPHCNFQDSMMQVYTMMVGEIGAHQYQDHLLAQVLYCIFVVLVVILLSNILIAIVGESYSVVKNERAEIIFWSNRLFFVCEMVAIFSSGRSLINRLASLCCWFQAHSYKESATHEDQAPHVLNNTLQSDFSEHSLSMKDVEEDLLREVWRELMIFVREESLEDPTLSEFLLSLFLRCLVCVVLIPIWLLIGVITAGLLWPPQVREWLHASNHVSSASRSVIVTQMRTEINRLTHDISDMSSKIQLDLNRVRKDLDDVKVDVKEFEKTCKIDLIQIKSFMSDLLEKYESDEQMDEVRSTAHSLPAL